MEEEKLPVTKPVEKKGGSKIFLYVMIIVGVMGIAFAFGLLYFYFKYYKINFNS